MIRWAKKYLILCLPVLLLTLSGHGQERQHFNGSLQIGPYSGNADFDYLIVGGDTIYDGDFRYQKSSLETVLQKRDTSFIIAGDFDKGVATGPWRFQFNSFQSDRNSKLVDFEYRVLVSGIQEEGSGSLSDGAPDGDWVYEVNKIKASEVESVLFKSEMTFDAGVPQQNFKIASDSVVLVGRFLRNGQAHDEWSSFAVNSVSETETWFFNEGLLQRIVIVSDGASNEIPVFENSPQPLQTIMLDKNYIKIVASAVKASGSSLNPKKGIAGLLTRNESYYNKLEDILSEMGSSGFGIQYRVKVPYKPLDSLESAQLSTVVSDFEAADLIANNLLNNSHLNIVKRTDPEVRYFYSVASAIKKDFLEPLRSLIAAQKDSIVPYLGLSDVLAEIWSNGKPEKRIEVKGDSLQADRTFALDNTETFDFEGNDLDSVGQLAAYAKMSMEAIEASLSDQLTSEESILALNSLEVDLIAKNDSLVRRIDSLQKTLPSSYHKALENIKGFADSALSSYAGMENMDQKLVYGNTLDVCMTSLMALSNTLGGLPSETEAIDSLYTDNIWNPFMATLMEETVKKRIINAHTKILIPSFLERIATDLSCDNVENISNGIGRANEMVVALREQDTKKLERKLRRAKEPSEILRLIEEFTSKAAEK
ncbi:hypothetical protein FGM00_07345 [Aggregatimonas sangjinii]|uniref:Uncharacterized protein n=1 Tax=Aggregatimonas sangjinii TaxID=2583587 RepID=A0A5B7SSD3_9FLAO|nr:hypothetical protein [Aggregatimonas sangjinii]QCW99922.1 hypothetical protein FGM00_07345 [Aggregatimonas sangjinii]